MYSRLKEEGGARRKVRRREKQNTRSKEKGRSGHAIRKRHSKLREGGDRQRKRGRERIRNSHRIGLRRGNRNKARRKNGNYRKESKGKPGGDPGIRLNKKGRIREIAKKERENWDCKKVGMSFKREE